MQLLHRLPRGLAVLVLACVVCAQVPVGSLVATANAAQVISFDGSTTVDVDAVTGRLSVLMGTQVVAVSAGTALGPACVTMDVQVNVSAATGTHVNVTRTLKCKGRQESVVILDQYAPARASVEWRWSVGSTGTSPFSLPIRTNMTWMSATHDRYWTTWGKGCVQNSATQPPTLCYTSGGPWQNPFSPESFPPPPPYGSQRFRLGMRGGSNRPAGSGPADDSMSIPMFVMLPASPNASTVATLRSLTMAMDPSDSMNDVVLQAGPGHAIGFVRYNMRINPLPQGVTSLVTSPTSGRTHIATSPHNVPSLRTGLDFVSSTFPSTFSPLVSRRKLADFEGLGSYSWNQQPYNVSRAQRLGFKTNWDLSGTFMPYDGLFIAYKEPWLNLGPINPGLQQYNVTTALMDAYYKRIVVQGFHSLSYFDIGNWGTRISFLSDNAGYGGTYSSGGDCGVRPNGMPAPCWDPANSSSSQYLAQYLMSALLQQGWSADGGSFHQAKKDWVGCTDMDPGAPIFQDLLTEQLRMHMSELQYFEGIAIDRLDYTEFYNTNEDDGISWVPRSKGVALDCHDCDSEDEEDEEWGPARSLRVSHRHTMQRLSSEILHRPDTPPDQRKIMLMNCNALCRIDLLGVFDGTFSEGSSLNAVAWTGLRQLTVLWTYGLGTHTADELDAYFQQHLLMDVYPMAPMPLNDHSIQPGNETVERFYADYAPLFDALHGADWLLTPQPITVIHVHTTSVSVNAFVAFDQAAELEPRHARARDAVTVATPTVLYPLMLGPPAGKVEAVCDLVGVEGYAADSRVVFEVLYPGEHSFSILTHAQLNKQAQAAVAVSLGARGAVLLRVRLAS